MITLEPVVVKPETISNKASTKFGNTPVITNGIAPTRLMTIHVIEQITKPSLA